MSNFRYRDQINPLVRIAAKTKPRPEDVDKIAMVALVALDAAKRGQAPVSLCNLLTEHLMVNLLLWSKQGNKALYDRAVAAWMAMSKACARDTKLLDLTTGEYQAIRTAISHYLRAVPKLEIGQLFSLHVEAQRKLGF